MHLEKGQVWQGRDLAVPRSQSALNLRLPLCSWIPAYRVKQKCILSTQARAHARTHTHTHTHTHTWLSESLAHHFCRDCVPHTHTHYSARRILRSSTNLSDATNLLAVSLRVVGIFRSIKCINSPFITSLYCFYIKLSLRSDCCILSFGWFHGVLVLCADVSAHSVPSS